MTDPTRRFSTRVDNYIRYRPSYPAEVIAWLGSACGLTSAAVVADMGSGTGILAELFLRNGNLVFGVEPNREMREAGDRLLAGYSNFKSIDAAAEATTLPDRSVDFVTAGQAFHWFDRDKARAEFTRILRPGGWVVLIWNDRRTGSTPFLQAYEQLLQRYGTDYAAVNHTNIDDDVIGTFFAPQPFELRSFPNRQDFDFEGVRGRLLSSSYAPEAGHVNYEPMLAELRSIFDTHQADGKVAFEYDTKVYYGHVSAET